MSTNGIVVNTNVSSLMVQRNLNKATNSLNSSIERMTTGLRINKAADDAAGLYVATGLDTQIRGSKIAEDNIQTGVNLLQIAEGDLSLVQEHIGRIRDLATQAASDYYTTDARTAMASEAAARVEEIDRLAKGSNFNQIKLLDGTRSSMRLQIGYGADATTNALTISGVFADTQCSSIGLIADSSTITNAFASATSAATFLTSCDSALTNVTNRRSQIGAIQNRLDSAYDSLLVQVENMSSAKSTIMDADIAEESSSYTQAQILQQAAASLLVQANQAPSIALSLV